MEMEGRKFRPPARLQLGNDAPDDRRRPVLHRRLAARCDRGGCRDRRDSLDVPAGGRRTRRPCASNSKSRAGVLDRWQGRWPRSSYFTWLSTGGSQREKWRPRGKFREERHRRTDGRPRSRDRQAGPDWVQFAGHCHPGRGCGGRRPASGQRACVQNKRAWIYSRVRRANWQTHLDVPHHSPSRRNRERNLGKGLVEIYR